MKTKENPDFWRDIQPGSTITLTDKQALEDSMEKGGGVRGMDYVVKLVRKIVQREAFVEWLFFRLEDPNQNLWLMVKIVEQDLKLVVYYEPSAFQPGNREELVKRNELWLFDEPEENRPLIYDELDFAPEINWIIDEPNNGNTVEREITYKMREQGVLYGMVSHTPSQVGLENVMGVVVEYHTEDDDQNPELIITEIGGEHKESGGLISAMFGIEVSTADVDVLNLTPDRVTRNVKPGFWEKIRKAFS